MLVAARALPLPDLPCAIIQRMVILDHGACVLLSIKRLVNCMESSGLARRQRVLLSMVNSLVRCSLMTRRVIKIAPSVSEFMRVLSSKLSEVIESPIDDRIEGRAALLRARMELVMESEQREDWEVEHR